MSELRIQAIDCTDHKKDAAAGSSPLRIQAHVPLARCPLLRRSTPTAPARRQRRQHQHHRRVLCPSDFSNKCTSVGAAGSFDRWEQSKSNGCAIDGFAQNARNVQLTGVSDHRPAGKRFWWRQTAPLGGS